LKKAPLALLLLALGGCGPHVGPPLVVPVTSAWTIEQDSLLEGPIGTDGEHLFATARDGGVIAVALATGKAAWHVTDLPGALAARRDLLVVHEPDGLVLALTPGEGTIVWSTPTGVRGPLPPLLDGDRVIVAGEGLSALDAATGAPLWSVPGDAPTVSTLPVSARGRLFMGEADGTLRCRDRETGRSLWTFATVGPILAPPALDASGRLFLGTTDRRFVSLSQKDGALRWTRRIGADIDQPPIVLGGKVLVGTQEGLLYAFERGSGDIDWRVPLPSRPLAPPLPLGSAILVACRESDIVAFDLRTSRRIATLKTPGEMRATLLLGDRLYVSERNPVVIACIRLNVTLGPPLPFPSAAPSRRKR
jgi:outer membrane protein assembly factor BamB